MGLGPSRALSEWGSARRAPAHLPWGATNYEEGAEIVTAGTVACSPAQTPVGISRSLVVSCAPAQIPQDQPRPNRDPLTSCARLRPGATNDDEGVKIDPGETLPCAPAQTLVGIACSLVVSCPPAKTLPWSPLAHDAPAALSTERLDERRHARILPELLERNGKRQ